MKIVFAFDSFKGSLEAREACEAAVEGWRSLHPKRDVLVTKPLADGGEGTASSVLGCRDGEWVECSAWAPLCETRVSAGYAWFPGEREALVEMASASGLGLLQPSQYDPLRASTFGTGELLCAALQREPRRILLAVGGSATVDGGTGAAAAMGWRFLDKNDRPLEPGGGSLHRLHRIVPPSRLELPPIEVLCDVDSPLLGPQGAAVVFGPQKGAGPEEVARLERGLTRLADLAREQLGYDMDIPGGGAAGGLAAGAAAFLGARLVPGISRIVALSDLDSELRDADWVVTGEGSLDSQSLRGKVVSGVIDAAKHRAVRVAVIAGRVRLSESEWREAGIHRALSLCGPDDPVEEAMAGARGLITQRARELAESLD